MAKQRIFLQSAIGLCFSLSLLCPAFAMASSYIFDEGMAQGDGDPNENDLLEVTAKEGTAEVDENVATITAEGDFLVPTYLLPVAEEEVNVVSENKVDSISKVDNNVSVTKTITTTTTTTTKEVPVFVVSESSKKKSGTDVEGISGAVPIVDVHAQLVEDEKVLQSEPVKIQQPTAGDIQKQVVVATHNIGTGYNTPKTVRNDIKLKAPEAPVVSKTVQTEQFRPVLIPLAPLPKTAEPEPTLQPHVRKIIPSEYADKMLTALEENKRPDFIMPQEIKVSFYKDASHFSGQTIKWIKAFSVNVMNDPRLIVQVRLSTQNPHIQQKRLSIIQNTLIGNGLSPHQIQVVFTNRPSDSLVLRTMMKPELEQVSVLNKKTGHRGEKRTTRW